MTASSEGVPRDWTPPPWLAVFGLRELQWLAARLDAANRELRAVNRRLAADRDRIAVELAAQKHSYTPEEGRA